MYPFYFCPVKGVHIKIAGRYTSDCGFGGECTGNNIYSYIDNSQIDTSSCNGKVSRESGCILFNKTSDTNLKYSSRETYRSVKNNGGQAVAPVVGDNSGGITQKDSNIIIKVERDRECAEWISFSKSGDSATARISEFDADGTVASMVTCTELSEDNRCLTYGNASPNKLDVGYYISQMTGEWANKDFSGFSIPERQGITYKTSASNENWWKTTSSSNPVAGSTYIFSKDYNEISNKVCKSYPEDNSPYNFSDKYDVNLYKCICDSGTGLGGDCKNTDENTYTLNEINKGKVIGYTGEWCLKIEDNYTKVFTYNNKVLAFTYNQYRELTPREYFKTVRSGVTIPYIKINYGINNESLIWIDDSQECYYQKVSYDGYNDPVEQYFGNNITVPQNVCYDTTTSKVEFDTMMRSNACDKTTSKKQTNYNNTSQSKYSDYRQGYCLEYNYSKEIYYKGSGKYNCITWIPGYIQ